MIFLKASIKKPLSFLSCGHFVATEKWAHARRTIDNFEIIIGVNGTAYIEQDKTKYEVKPGSALLLLPGHDHGGYAFSEPNTSFYWLHFLCNEEYSILDEREAYVQVSPLKSNPYTNKLNENILIPTYLYIDSMEKLLIQFRQLLHISNTSYYTGLSADYLLTLMMIELTQLNINSISENINESEDVTNRRFINILEWLRLNVHNKIYIHELADRFDFNADYLTRLFKKHLGVSAMEYINGMKVSKAKELLSQSEKTVKEISFSLGFQDEKYFMKLFKDYEGITPSQYRNAYYKTYINNR